MPSVTGPGIDGETSYEEWCLNFGFPGNGRHNEMYRRLKQRAFRKIKKQLGQRPKKSRILVVSGIREDESAIRAGYKRAFAEEPSECFVWMNPFYHCTAYDFECYRQEFGLPRNPVKQLVGISGECECGAHAVEGERDAITKAEPDFRGAGIRDRRSGSRGRNEGKDFCSKCANRNSCQLALVVRGKNETT